MTATHRRPSPWSERCGSFQTGTAIRVGGSADEFSAERVIPRLPGNWQKEG
jgi:hypothetical protein